MREPSTIAHRRMDHAIAERARRAVRHDVPRFRDATVHVDACGHDGTDPHHGTRHHAGD